MAVTAKRSNRQELTSPPCWPNACWRVIARVGADQHEHWKAMARRRNERPNFTRMTAHARWEILTQKSITSITRFSSIPVLNSCVGSHTLNTKTPSAT